MARIICDRLSSVLYDIFLLYVVFTLSVSGGETDNDEWEDYLLCRQCGHDVTKATDLIRQTSHLSLNQRNDTILGVDNILIQLFKNPQGRYFELITASLADVKKTQQVYSQDSWFPSYSWRIVYCSHCKTHLGWSFEPNDYEGGVKDSEETFYGLILNHLIHQEYADSLVMSPKIYAR
ncbi:protein cereblon-like [Asterias rubens]|uniref:protein cereblon-like n=1 Tax=Asterias rubens TaxID=7604 RepID=UPI001455AFF5|nr:protein cereblon-like [Asterias rubens]